MSRSSRRNALQRLFVLFAAAMLLSALPALAEEPTDAPAWTLAGVFEPNDYLIPTPQLARFSRCGYALEYGCFFVEYRESGHLYAYMGVDTKEWNAFSRAASPESYFDERIADEYDCYRVR